MDLQLNTCNSTRLNVAERRNIYDYFNLLIKFIIG